MEISDRNSQTLLIIVPAMIFMNYKAFLPSSSPGTTQPIVGVYFTALYRALASSRTRLLDHTQRCATVGSTPLNE